MSSVLLTAIGLMLVFEGLMPLLLPAAWRDTFKRMILLEDGQLRFIGLMSVIGGLTFMYFSR